MSKDWTGNSKALFSILAASNHSDENRVINDYYATPPQAVEKLLQYETFSHHILEPAVGGGHIANVLTSRGHEVQCMDIVDRGYPNTVVKDFLHTTKDDFKYAPDIITNPPYAIATEFAEHALGISMDSVKVAMFLKIQFLETKKRRELFKEHPPKRIYVFVSRVNCGKNGMFTGESSAVCYAWFVWERGYKGNPEILWID